MRLVALRYSDEPNRMIEFYEALGLLYNRESSVPQWQVIGAASGAVAVHPAKEFGHTPGDVEVCCEAEEPLENNQRRLTQAGFDPGQVYREDYGSHLMVTDPDGFVLRINGLS